MNQKTKSNPALSANIGRLAAAFMQRVPEGTPPRENRRSVAHPLQHAVVRYLWSIAKKNDALPSLGDIHSIYIDARDQEKCPVSRFRVMTEVNTPTKVIKASNPVQQVLSEVMSGMTKAERSEFSVALTKFAWAHFKCEGKIEAEDLTAALSSCPTAEELVVLADEVKAAA